MTTPLDALEQLSRMSETGALDGFCERHDLELMVAFGSAANPQRLQPPGDLDLAVRFAGDGDLVALVNDLIDLLDLDAIDVLDLRRAGIVARAAAFKPPNRPLYERDPGAYADAQMAALTMELDTNWLRRLDLELMAGS